jgi:hypothetical protein
VAVILIVTGALSLGFKDIYWKALEFLPHLTGAGGLVEILPYTAVTFGDLIC